MSNTEWLDSAILFGVYPPNGGGGGGTVDSVTGLSPDQVVVDNTDPNNPVLSMSETLNLPGTLNIQSSTAIDEIINDDTLETATSTNLATAAATKQYIDSVSSGFTFQPACACATTTNLTVTYDNGVSGVGATLTNTGSLAVFNTDGVSPPINSRVLVSFQSAPEQNGIYDLTTVGDVSTPWVLTRSTDFDTPAEIKPGDFVIIVSGSLYADSGWVQTATITTVGTSAVTFVKFGIQLPASIANGGTSVTSVTTVPNPVSWAGWDTNKNLSANNFLIPPQIINNNATTTVFTVASPGLTIFTGTNFEIAQLPDVTTLAIGFPLNFINNSNNAVFVISSGSDTVVTMQPLTQVQLTCDAITGTSASSWTVQYTSSGLGVQSITAVAPLATSSPDGNVTLTYTGINDVEVQQSAFNYGVDTGLADSYIVALSPVVSAMTDGLLVSFLPSANNASPYPTLNVGPASIQIKVVQADSFIAINNIVANVVAHLIYCAADNVFYLLNPQQEYAIAQDVLAGTRYWSGTDTGVSADNYAVTIDFVAMYDPNVIYPQFIMLNNVNATNTGPATLVVNSLPVVAISSGDNGNLNGGEMQAGQSYFMVFNGSKYVIMNTSNPSSLVRVHLPNSASSPYFVPLGINSIVVQIIGGGGGGGGATGGVSTTSAGAGGGGGGYASLLIPDCGGNSYAYVIGAGGAGGSAGNNAGSAGGNTTFGASLQATGGAGGGGMSTVSTATIAASAAGVGGVGSNGDVNSQGDPGTDGITGLGNFVVTGNGGGTTYGGGGYTLTTGVGALGGNYGGGGAGALSLTTSNAGGNGSPGIIIIYEYK